MHVIIVGAGEVGFNIAKKLEQEGRDVFLIDNDKHVLEEVSSSLDVQVIEGSGSSPNVLKQAGIDKADMLIAVTNNDDTNMIACLIAKSQPNKIIKVARIANTEIAYNSKIIKPEYLSIDYVINPKRATAIFIEKLLQTPEAGEVFEYLDGEVKLIGLKVDKKNPFVGKHLKEIRRKSLGFDYLITAMLRKNDIIIPSGDNQIKDGDTIYTLIENKNIPKLYKAFEVSMSPVNRVIILGGNTTAFTLAKRLNKDGIDVKIIEKNKARCEELADVLDNVMILNGDATDKDLLVEEGIAKTDCFIAASKDDETNILSCLLATKLGANRAIPLVTKVAYLPLVEKVGIDVAVRPRQIIINHILKFLRRGKMLSVASIGDERAETMEVEVSESSPLLNKPLKNLKVPKGAIIGAIARDGKPIIAKGEDFFKPHDKVIIFSLQSAINSVQQSLTSKLGA